MMKIIRFLTANWWLLYSITLTTIIIYFALGVWGEPSAEDDTIIYAQVILRAMGVWFVLFLVLLLGTAAWLYYKKHRNADRSAALFGVPLIPIFVTSFFAAPSIGDQRLFHIASARFEGNVYHVAEYQARFWLALYECDGVGVVCHTIYRGSTITNLNCAEICNDPPQLIFIGNALSLIVRGETVFVYTPS